jgi:hypothetical protein
MDIAMALGEERRRKKQFQTNITTADNNRASPKRAIRAGEHDQHHEAQENLDATRRDPANSRILAMETL